MPLNPNLKILFDTIDTRLNDDGSPEVVESLLATLFRTDLCSGNNNILVSLITRTNDANAMNACAILHHIHNFSMRHPGEKYHIMSILMRQTNSDNISPLYWILMHPVPVFVDTYFSILDRIVREVPVDVYFNLINSHLKLPANLLYKCNPPVLGTISSFEVALFSTKWDEYSRHLRQVLSLVGNASRVKFRQVDCPSIDNIIRYGDINTLRRCLDELSFLRKNGLLAAEIHLQTIEKSLESNSAFPELTAQCDLERIALYLAHILTHAPKNSALYRRMVSYSPPILSAQKPWTSGEKNLLFTANNQQILEKMYQDDEAKHSFECKHKK